MKLFEAESVRQFVIGFVVTFAIGMLAVIYLKDAITPRLLHMIGAHDTTTAQTFDYDFGTQLSDEEWEYYNSPEYAQASANTDDTGCACPSCCSIAL
jgi:hypothetical protein